MLVYTRLRTEIGTISRGIRKQRIGDGNVCSGRIFVSITLLPVFKAYSKHNICGTMKIVPTGTSENINISDDSVSEKYTVRPTGHHR